MAPLALVSDLTIAMAFNQLVLELVSSSARVSSVKSAQRSVSLLAETQTHWSDHTCAISFFRVHTILHDIFGFDTKSHEITHLVKYARKSQELQHFREIREIGTCSYDPYTQLNHQD